MNRPEDVLGNSPPPVYSFSPEERSGTVVRPVQYPWDEWLKQYKNRKREVILIRGIDYECQTHGMAQQIRNRAGKEDVPVSLDLEEDRIHLTIGAADA